MSAETLPFPLLSEADAAISAAALAAASCRPDGNAADDILDAQRHFLAHYRFLLERKWPEPARSLSQGMHLGQASVS